MAYVKGGNKHDFRRGAPVENATRMPASGELIGKVTKIAGATKFFVACTDSNTRLCSIPGRLRRKFWIKTNDVVIVRPWVVQTNERADIVWRYSLLDINRLKERHLLDTL
jgi:translation initiation factor 1A